MRLLLFVSILTLTISACAEKKDDKKLKHDYALNIGETIEIKLPATPSTGFMWRQINRTSNNAIKHKQTGFTPSNPDLIGSAGINTFFYEGVRSGVDTLIMQYMQPLKPESKTDERKFVVKVN